MTYLDTHVAIWLVTGSDSLSQRALAEIEKEDLRLSPMVLLELQFLKEIGRVRPDPDWWLMILERDFGVGLCSLPMAWVTKASYAETWTLNPFDRMIVAQTKAAGGRLLSADRRILDNFSGAIW